MTNAQTAYVFDEAFLGHDTGERTQRLPDGSELDPVEHPSNNRITRRTHQLIAGSGLLDRLTRIPARPATIEEIRFFHTPGYIDHVRAVAAAGGGMLDDQTRVSEGSFEAALLAAGGAIELADAVVDGRVRNGYGLLRPIGHHAMADQGMGFCVFNNAAIVARHLRRRRGIDRVAIVDWDVHHGNGTQSAVWDDPSVLFVSLHQENWYPGGWGGVDDIGGAAAEGTTVNLPLPPGTGNTGYRLAFERVVEPILRRFEPEVVIVSAGQDGGMADPLGRMLLTMAGFRELARRLQAVAEEVCGGRLIGLQEGGYSVSYTPFCTLGVVEGFAGAESGIGDPWQGSSEVAQAEREHHARIDEAIERARAVQAPYWGP
ncbi:MAG: Acetylspermidine deacetylase; Deacetylases, including yeast histone deacetylase and acetoin utilization protein [uncultured Thermomicrobiales bacterium]|uniref:Acetylspermidine deacetylase Deacetylases, including yeast histone deacetylase and acetoin utilization protein n=1 Tax=uncultured Thermomicrobiales bacterium TaxID=1645740 RepID=A0A6J4U1I8_9BACT|nr:MAG: Acetylspermidine deacetylase; Deacetylases, including yeast histone deacetylase and acetoin utilization protein [uncultured Thermomicrobiales bacterium]